MSDTGERSGQALLSPSHWDSRLSGRKCLVVQTASLVLSPHTSLSLLIIYVCRFLLGYNSHITECARMKHTILQRSAAQTSLLAVS